MGMSGIIKNQKIKNKKSSSKEKFLMSPIEILNY
jgi:hypothetical protein